MNDARALSELGYLGGALASDEALVVGADLGGGAQDLELARLGREGGREEGVARGGRLAGEGEALGVGGLACYGLQLFHLIISPRQKAPLIPSLRPSRDALAALYFIMGKTEKLLKREKKAKKKRTKPVEQALEQEDRLTQETPLPEENLQEQEEDTFEKAQELIVG